MLFTAEKQAKNEHDTDTDIMRIIASFFVVMIHLSDFSSLSSIFYNSIAHFSVPVFVIISGYYILGNNQCGKTLIIKTLKLFLAMILCSFFHLTIDLIFETKIISSAIEILYFLFTEPGHLWYIYATMTLYLFTPLIAIFHNHADKKTYLYALILTFFFGSVITIFLRSGYFSILEKIIDKMKVAHTLGFVFLYLTGGFIKKFKITNLNLAFVLFIAGSILSILGSILLPPSRASLLSLSFFAPNTIMAGIGFFLLIKSFFCHHPIKNNKIKHTLHDIGDYTFGIYLFHPLIIQLMDNFIFSKIVVSEIFSIPIKTFWVFIVSGITVYLLKKIPLFKSLI